LKCMSSWLTVNHSHTRQELSRLGRCQDAIFEPNLDTRRGALCTREEALLHRFVFSVIPTLLSMQDRALQTRAQPTPWWRCTRAVCGVSSKQNPLSPQTPYDPENKHLFPIQAQAVPSLATSQPWRLCAGGGICVSTISHDGARNWDAAAAAVIAAPASLLDGDFRAL